MKKAILSIALLAASGGYVAAANHLLGTLPGQPLGDDAATVAPAFAPLPSPAKPAPRLDTASAASPVAPASSVLPDPVRTPSPRPQPVPTLPTPVVPAAPRATIALAEPQVAPVLPATPPATAPQDVAAAPVAPQPHMPPLPRPRPANAPSIQTVQSTPTVAANSGRYRDGTYTGLDENAYYGRVQVRVTVSGGQIANVRVLDYPSDRRTSRYINSQALPLLQQEVMQTQSAFIDTISGATLTSEAYIRSLGGALAQAGGSNA